MMVHIIECSVLDTHIHSWVEGFGFSFVCVIKPIFLVTRTLMMSSGAVLHI
ncbi:hypothetical protein BDQ17DRAFT_1352196 [Cyathus striatus]|nr:hypothetical protein BDQ17DRAFT_1352196 [Cyathus striatus]